MATPQKHLLGHHEIQRLSQLCLPRWYGRIESVVVRPERPEFAAIMKGQVVNPSWTRALDQMCQAINNSYGSDQPQRHQKAKIRPDRKPMSPMDAFFQGLEAFDHPDDKAKPLLGTIALILYDLQSSGAPPPYSNYGIGRYPVANIGWGSYFYREGLSALSEICAYLTQFAGRCRKGQLAPLEKWEALASELLDGCGTELTPEVALALYYYQTHRRDIEQAEYERGLTGYTGIMQELIDEIPIRSPDRFLRKLVVSSLAGT
ncbi:hypothetical protein B0H63DRAFT_507521 [Podospora didyma]|uniref:Uncharacterized protein n=1 Tax=Podospora didyma TaxID=330526 RepID=A0AAE0NYL0_9PEZI|nr:hypothetical protein B0H63DRAFT_507521 [Podospora didyma]